MESLRNSRGASAFHLRRCNSSRSLKVRRRRFRYTKPNNSSTTTPMNNAPRISTIKGVEKSHPRKDTVMLAVFCAARMMTASANTTPKIKPQKRPVPTNTRSRISTEAVSLLSAATGSDGGACPSLALSVMSNVAFLSLSSGSSVCLFILLEVKLTCKYVSAQLRHQGGWPIVPTTCLSGSRKPRLKPDLSSLEAGDRALGSPQSPTRFTSGEAPGRRPIIRVIPNSIHRSACLRT